MRILCINDISCVGKCSLTVAHPIISASGVTCDMLPTAILSTHTGGFTGYTFRDLSSDIMDIIAHWESLNIKYDIIYSGYLGSFAQIDMVKEAKKRLLKPDGVMIVDPVMGDNGVLYSNFDADFVRAMGLLCREADYIVPNPTEACFITGSHYSALKSADDYITLIKKLQLYCPSPVLTGAEFDGKDTVFYIENGRLSSYSTDFIKGSFHGAGDVFASAFTACLANGFNLSESVKHAADFTCASIKQTDADKTEARYGLNFESQIFGFLKAIKA